jgi:hypothetical protein
MTSRGEDYHMTGSKSDLRLAGALQTINDDDRCASARQSEAECAATERNNCNCHLLTSKCIHLEGMGCKTGFGPSPDQIRGEYKWTN